MRQLTSSRLTALLANMCAFVLASTAAAQQGEIEEVVVTGSYIAGSPEDAASPISVTTREDMDLSGNPSLVEMIKRFGPVSGVDGESNQFQSNGLEAISNVNLRGLGPGRTLVLLNGTRMVPTPFAVPETGQQFVNTNVIPAIALERIELLKDGASATYGSDAVAGVANFITRSEFRGVEVAGTYKGIDDSEDDGDWDAGIIAGLGGDRWDLVGSFGYQFRTEVAVREKDWALRDFATNPRGGWSGIGSPSTYFAFPGFTARAADPDCETVGGFLDDPGGTETCRFRYTDFDNIAEEEEHWQLFVEGNYEINDSMTLTGEFLYAKDEASEWKTSPSYPPQVLFGTDRVVVPGMPHFDDFLARNPDLAGDFAAGAFVLGRFQGVSGPAQQGDRTYDTWRVKVGLEGEFGDGVLYTGSISYSTSEIDINTNDSRIDRVAYAYRGLGGPDCDPATGTPGSGNLGTGDCWYFNPFTSGYTASQAAGFEGVPGPGSGNSQLNNPAFMQDWLTDFLGGKTETELFVFDLVFSGETGIDTGAGAVGWAAGVQYRRDDFKDKPLTSTNVLEQPCAFGLGAAGDTFTIPAIDLGGGNSIPSYTYECSGTGAYHFLAAGLPSEDDQDVYAGFAELAIPFTENLNMQVAVRYEDYGGDVGDTLDPKVAATWDVMDWVRLRGSISSSFRAPSLNQLSGVGTSLQFVAPTGAFKAIDTFGNPNIPPEEAITTNFGIILTPNENWFISLDYWNFDFRDPITLENFGDVVSNCTDDTSEIQDFACSKIVFQDPDNPTPAGIQRVEVTYQPGPDIETDGIDWQVTWDIPTDDWGIFTLGTSGTWINEYKVDDWIWADGFDAVGDLNRFESIARPLPEVKANFSLNWTLGRHNVRLENWYTDEYNDKSEPAGADWSIDDHSTWDIHYNFRFNNDNTRVFASVYNFTDEDPPLARLDLNYDPYSHNPFGTMWKIGVNHRFEGGIFQ